MKMIKNKIVTLLLLFFAFTALFVGGTLAWLSIGDTQNTNLNLGDFTVSSIVKDGNTIATISKQIFRFMDTYVIDVDEQNALCALLVVVSIDAIKCSSEKA